MEEYDTERLIQRSGPSRRRFVVREFDEDGYATPSIVTLARTHTYSAALQTTRARPMNPTTVRAQLWMGRTRAWVQFYPDPDQH
ncbi:hypothetical protein BJF83_21455 [Nocardiopsis sp. CNR-923]|uniref:hypothetical protein n=1 Tax=Nocardiopsis sp. CNR-923 TaxID=1904965 RepID=UPI00095B9D91|nr:hypothetical protein [Nocardiopsis sp. CNR-923]OLT26370.1 hypothetical protein BJF83_21455 [Nocardiopsis sp. CNR-923]